MMFIFCYCIIAYNNIYYYLYYFLLSFIFPSFKNTTYACCCCGTSVHSVQGYCPSLVHFHDKWLWMAARPTSIEDTGKKVAHCMLFLRNTILDTLLFLPINVKRGLGRSGSIIIHAVLYAHACCIDSIAHIERGGID